MYEQHFRLNVSKIKDFNIDLRGEITIVISEKAENESKIKLDEKDKKLIKKLMKKLSIKDIVTDIKKIKIYLRKKFIIIVFKLKNEK